VAEVFPSFRQPMLLLAVKRQRRIPSGGRC